MTATRDARITWYGHACTAIEAGGRTILVDPWFGNPKSPLAAAAVPACDLLLVTHGHGDHFGDAPALAERFRPAWPAIHELSLYLHRTLSATAAAGVVGMNKGGTVGAAGFRVTMVPADHSAGEMGPDDDRPVYLGEPAGFVIELPSGRRIYHAGDTNVFGDMTLIRDLHRPDIALLPIGGHYTMDPVAAALAVELLGVGEVLPIHWGTFPALAGTPAALRAELATRGLGAVVVHELEPGGSIPA